MREPLIASPILIWKRWANFCHFRFTAVPQLWHNCVPYANSVHIFAPKIVGWPNPFMCLICTSGPIWTCAKSYETGRCANSGVFFSESLTLLLRKCVKFCTHHKNTEIKVHEMLTNSKWLFCIKLRYFDNIDDAVLMKQKTFHFG